MTGYDCFFAQTENRKWGAEFTYDEYRLERFSYCMVITLLQSVLNG